VDVEQRAEVHAALGEPIRLAIVDELGVSDRSPSELCRRLQLPPPLLAFHLDTLQRAGVIERIRSSGDGRRKYVRLRPERLRAIGIRSSAPEGPVVFVCTRNSARSQLAAALWRRDRSSAAASAGTRPADAVDPGAIAAANRAHLDLGATRPRRLTADDLGHCLITVCDQAHEELDHPAWHWSIPDPVGGDAVAFDRAVAMLRDRIAAIPPAPPRPRSPQEAS
jgi:protein-tyrosine-phosphatase